MKAVLRGAWVVNWTDQGKRSGLRGLRGLNTLWKLTMSGWINRPTSYLLLIVNLKVIGYILC